MATIITKNSSTASAVPLAGQLVQGELAVNVTDKKVYTKDASANVVKLVGSLGNQEANAVAITGGTMSSVAVTGGSTINTTHTNPTIVGGTQTSPTITTPTINNPTITGGTITGASVSGSASINVQRFSGDGVTTVFTLSANPVSENNTQIYINGVYQQKDTYTVSGTTLTFSEAPVADTDNIEVVTTSLQSLGSTTSDLVTYTPAGTGAVASTVQSKLRESVSVKDFGAVGDGVANDTSAIQAAVSHAIANNKNLLIPAGTYMINAVGSGTYPNTDGGIVINGPLTIFMYEAKLKAITNNSTNYTVLNIRNANDVFVFGGEVEGDRTAHTGVTGEQGHGIVITGSTDVHLRDMYVSNCWGDCVSVRTDGNAVNKRITLDNVTHDAARRNGLTVQLVDGFLATGCRFINTGNGATGTAPKSGVDLEPNSGEGASKNVIFQNCYFANNTTSDFIGGGGDGIENVLISNCTFADTVAGGLIIGGATLCKNVEISNNVMSMAAGSGIGIQIGSSTNVKVLDNVITRAGTYSADSSAGLYADGTSTNVVFRGNQVSGFRQGIQIQTTTVNSMNIEGNEIVGCARGILGNAVATKVVIRNNTFRDLLSYAVQCGFVDSIFSDNLFEDVDLRATLIGSISGTLVSGNIFNRVGTNDQANEPCMGFSGAVDNCDITNNVFYSATAGQDAIRASVAPTTPSFFNNNVARYGSQTDVFVLHANHIVGENFANTTASGSFTLSAAATRVVTNNNVTAASKIILTPTNAAAATLMSGAKSLYVSTKTAATSFTVATADGTNAAGTETFDYKIVA